MYELWLSAWYVKQPCNRRKQFKFQYSAFLSLCAENYASMGVKTETYAARRTHLELAEAPTCFQMGFP